MSKLILLLILVGMPTSHSYLIFDESAKEHAGSSSRFLGESRLRVGWTIFDLLALWESARLVTERSWVQIPQGARLFSLSIIISVFFTGPSRRYIITVFPLKN